MNARVTIFTVVVVITCIAIEMGEQGPSQYPGNIDGEEFPTQLFLSSDVDTRAKKRYDSSLSGYAKKRQRMFENPSSLDEDDIPDETDKTSPNNAVVPLVDESGRAKKKKKKKGHIEEDGIENDANPAEDDMNISLLSSLKNFEFRYIKQIWCGISVDGYYLKSESFKDLLSLAEKHSVIVVKGPKGIGKSSSLVGMLAKYSISEIPAILLTQDSIKCPLATFSYLNKVAERFNLGKYQQCRFRPFTKEEADMYLSRNCLTLDLNLVFELTHYNPWLLSNLPQGNININETIGIIKLQMFKYIRNLLDSFKAIPLNNWVSSNLEETDRWLYKATNGVHLNQNDLNLFHLSWVCAECICDLQVTENKNYTVVCNFPYVHKLLLMELSTLKKSNKIPSNPIINGFIFEADFLRGVHNLRFIETLSDGKKFTFDIQYLYSLGIDEKLTNMETGVLYHLRHKHPVIDAVGILKRQDKKKYHLVFIQVSMSKYSSHSSKIEDLYRMIGCKELKTSSFASIFDFYMSMTAALVKMRKAFYIYVSPFEVGPEASNQLIGYIYPDLKIGVMPKLSETESLVSRIVSQFS